MKKTLLCLFCIGINIFLNSCATPPPLAPKNTVLIDPVPSQMLALAEVYKANLVVLEQAFLAGVIDEQYYLSAKYQFNKALREQLVMYEGSLHNERFTAPPLEED